MVRSIPQEWNGIRYRSRTEARWGCFFTLAAIPFEYEPEGFDLDGEWYVPDFKVADLYFEIKGARPTVRERRLANGLATAAGCPVVLAVGNPGRAKLTAYGVEDGIPACVIVEEFRSERGAWLARFVDGGSWALPLCDGLENCSATGEAHPLLAEASRLQFATPIAQPDTGLLPVGSIANNIINRIARGRLN